MRLSSRILPALAAAVLALGGSAAAYGKDLPNIDRYQGPTRYQTAIAAAQAFTTSGLVYLARGDSQADAVVGGKLPGGPLLLVNSDPSIQARVAQTINKLQARKVIVLGGPAAVAEAWVRAVAGSRQVERISGDTRFATAVAISKRLHPNPGPIPKVYIANGKTLVDALAGGTIPDSYPILLTSDANTIPRETAKELARLAPDEVVALGGPGAVSEQALQAAGALAKGTFTQQDARSLIVRERASKYNEICLQAYGWETIHPSLRSSATILRDDSQTVSESALPNRSDFEKTVSLEVLESGWPRVCRGLLKPASEVPYWQDSLALTSETRGLAELPAMVSRKLGNDTLSYQGLLREALPNGSYPDVAGLSEALTNLANQTGLSPDTPATDGGSPAESAVARVVKVLRGSLGDNYFHSETNHAVTTLGQVFAALGVEWTNDMESAKASLLAAYSNPERFSATAIDRYRQTQTQQRTQCADSQVRAARAAAYREPTNQEVNHYVMSHSQARVSRLGGNDRSETARIIADFAYPKGAQAKFFYFANGRANADATVAGFLDNSPVLAGPLLLTERNTLPVASLEYLFEASRFVYGVEARILGGQKVVARTVEEQIALTGIS